MYNLSKAEILRMLKDQRDIFGDELFIPAEWLIKKIERPHGHKKENIISVDSVAYQTEKVKIEDTEDQVNLFDQREKWLDARSLDELNSLICNCTKCELHKGRYKFVFGSGNPEADILVIGEGPGAEEDKQGLPFVGRAGQLLTEILKAIKFEREEVYIGNIVKCRPPGNRTPSPQEMETCIPYLKKQIELINPKLILCLGLTAAQGLLKKKESLTNLRGKVFEYGKIKVMVTYHPAALLRNPNWKRGCWEDVKLFRKLYDQILNGNA